MNDSTKVKIQAYLQEQIANGESRVRSFVFDENNVRRLQRNAFVKLAMYINNFARNPAVRSVIMYGLRGAGKTTLLAQLYEQTKIENRRRLFLSVEQITSTLGFTLAEVLAAYEDLLGVSFEQLQEPLYLFLDEVQYDKKWGTALKSLYERSTKVFVIATGSSALSLQASPDVTRRSVFVMLHPMSFAEYIKIKTRKMEIKGLGAEIRRAVFESNNAYDVYVGLQKLEPKIKQYWADVDPREIGRYMQYGSLPFMVRLNNEALIYDQIKRTLDAVISKDIPLIAKFTTETLAKIPMVLYAIAESDQMSMSSMAKNISISRPVLTSVLDTLERTETIWRIYPYGSHMMQVRKSSKYLFTSPAFRAMHFNLIGNIRAKENYKGMLLEDTIGLYLRRLFLGKPDTAITFDSATHGADFIVRTREKVLVLEVGFGDKLFDQVAQTMQRTGLSAAYGLVISERALTVKQDKNIVSIPIRYFLLA